MPFHIEIPNSGPSTHSQKMEPNSKDLVFTLACVALWIEHWPANRKVTSSIPSQGICLSVGPGPQLGACERQWVNVSLAH